VRLVHEKTDAARKERIVAERAGSGQRVRPFSRSREKVALASARVG
jgi:hypothetical protein